ncbi:hypothetical protein Ae706Ps2_4119c [Pseudonocardia sp. Ae706_Ps2]|nr:hypothetical protein Ae505Ps2_1160 [Pseudonocardia sp. Ae505_Ps2]OLM25686.1 hypothetical protein Ae706Ps2_4119c [Pseudonocardia sp. Ae706_Ps2]
MWDSSSCCSSFSIEMSSFIAWPPHGCRVKNDGHTGRRSSSGRRC